MSPIAAHASSVLVTNVAQVKTLAALEDKNCALEVLLDERPLDLWMTHARQAVDRVDKFFESRRDHIVTAGCAMPMVAASSTLYLDLGHRKGKKTREKLIQTCESVSLYRQTVEENDYLSPFILAQIHTYV